MYKGYKLRKTIVFQHARKLPQTKARTLRLTGAIGTIVTIVTTGTMMNPDRISEFLTEQRDAAPSDLQGHFMSFEDFWERKLWHQLTVILVQYFEHPESAPQRLAVYNNFVLSFADKISQLQLVTIGLSAAEQCKDAKERLSFFSALAAKVDKPTSQDAFVYVTVIVAEVKLLLGDLSDMRKDLRKAELILEGFDSVESVVHAAFYRVSADYFQAKLDFTLYYRHTLLYLACVDLSDLSSDERQKRAYELSVAALMSDSIYNFGELLLHPILDSLKETSHDWLRDLVFVINRGDLVEYDETRNHLSKNTLMLERKSFLDEKISMSALTEAVFKRAPHDRTITFQDLAKETRVGFEHMEHLVMKAMSLGLVRGSIDQVNEVARITWVQPKVLDMKQIDSMRRRLNDWDDSVNQLGNWIETVGQDVWAS